MAINRVTYPSTPTPVSGDWDKIVDLMQTGYLKMENALRIDYDNDNVLEGAVFHIGGDVFLADSDTAITGTPSDYVQLTVSGSTASAAYVANLTGVTWNDAQNGYYDISGNLYIFNEANTYLKNELSGVNTEFGEVINTLALFGKGYMSLDLTEYDTTTAPQIAAGSVVEINGKVYRNDSAVTITGSVSNSTWYDILLTPSGSSYSATYVARNTGVFDISKGGLYSGNNRVVACIYVDSGGDYINKNILIIKNRNISIKMQIGDWNIYTTLGGSVSKSVAHGLSNYKNISSYTCVIRDDADSVYTFFVERGTVVSSNVFTTGVTWDSSNINFEASQSFNNASYNSTSYNRGEITLTYEVN